MADVEIPNFGALLSDHLSGVPQSAYPYLLSRLERTAADRYRGWAEQVPEHRDGLLACAAREDQIAERVEAMFPPTADDRARVDRMLPAARDAYYAAFDGYTAFEQMTIQADAEKQGAGAWQTLKQAHPELATDLERLSTLELESATFLDDLIGSG